MTDRILPYSIIEELWHIYEDFEDFACAIEQDVLHSEQVQAWKRDKERLDWLADPKNSIGNVQLPTGCVERNPHSLRDAIDDAMEQQK